MESIFGDLMCACTSHGMNENRSGSGIRSSRKKYSVQRPLDDVVPLPANGQRGTDWMNGHPWMEVLPDVGPTRRKESVVEDVDYSSGLESDDSDEWADLPYMVEEAIKTQSHTTSNVATRLTVLTRTPSRTTKTEFIPANEYKVNSDDNKSTKSRRQRQPRKSKHHLSSPHHPPDSRIQIALSTPPPITVRTPSFRNKK